MSQILSRPGNESISECTLTVTHVGIQHTLKYSSGSWADGNKSTSFSKSVMVSIAVSKMGMIFVDPGMKVSGQYYTSGSADAASHQACCRRLGLHLSFNKTKLHLIVPRTPLNCYSKKLRTSLVLISGHQTAQTWIQWIIRSGVLCRRECMNVVWTASMSWSSTSFKSGTVCSRTLLTRPSTLEKATESVQLDNILNIYW